MSFLRQQLRICSALALAVYLATAGTAGWWHDHDFRGAKECGDQSPASPPATCCCSHQHAAQPDDAADHDSQSSGPAPTQNPPCDDDFCAVCRFLSAKSLTFVVTADDPTPVTLERPAAVPAPRPILPLLALPQPRAPPTPA